ncbi:hypothetical protein D5H75_38280 [Bailinhaonella thermotolerans]|uniref:Uncharacterized protein n=1 Tax=Bailinhaonella thermotolerans TaxID=1070861 RepID=A0A3A4A637_9ACTN|nr:hypothetical protein D5H75_38280 [Bailinhaonella thermotolerans]
MDGVRRLIASATAFHEALAFPLRDPQTGDPVWATASMAEIVRGSHLAFARLLPADRAEQASARLERATRELYTTVRELAQVLPGAKQAWIVPIRRMSEITGLTVHTLRQIALSDSGPPA